MSQLALPLPECTGQSEACVCFEGCLCQRDICWNWPHTTTACQSHPVALPQSRHTEPSCKPGAFQVSYACRSSWPHILKTKRKRITIHWASPVCHNLYLLLLMSHCRTVLSPQAQLAGFLSKQRWTYELECCC